MNPNEKTESLKKALNNNNRPFDEAEYYKSSRVEIGGDDVLDEPEEHEDPEEEEADEEFYGDED